MSHPPVTRQQTFASIFAAFTAAFIVTAFLRSANAVIAPDLMSELSLNARQLGQMTSLYYITYAIMQLPLGAALDRYGSRVVIPILMVPTIIGCLLYATATSYWQVSVARMCIGIGSAGGLMGAVKTFGAWVPRSRLAAMTTSIVAFGTIGGILSTTPMAWVNDLYGWRSIFVGSALAVAATALWILLGTTDTPQATRTPPQAGKLFAGIRDIFANADFRRIAPIYFSMLGTLLAVQTLWAGPFLYDVIKVDAATVGASLLLMNVGSIVGYVVSGLLFERFGVTRLVTSAQIVLLLCLGYWVFLPLALPLWGIQIVYFLFGVSTAFNVIMLPQVRALFSEQMSGRATTTLNLFGFGGAWVLQWGMGLIIQALGHRGESQYDASGYQWAFGLLLLIGVIGLIRYWPVHVANLRKEH